MIPSTRSWAESSVGSLLQVTPLSRLSVTDNHKLLQWWIMSIKTYCVMLLPIHSTIHKQQIWLEQSKWTAGSCMSDLAVLQGSIIITEGIITASTCSNWKFLTLLLQSFYHFYPYNPWWVGFLLAERLVGFQGNPSQLCLKHSLSKSLSKAGWNTQQPWVPKIQKRCQKKKMGKFGWIF